MKPEEGTVTLSGKLLRPLSAEGVIAAAELNEILVMWAVRSATSIWWLSGSCSRATKPPDTHARSGSVRGLGTTTGPLVHDVAGHPRIPHPWSRQSSPPYGQITRSIPFADRPSLNIAAHSRPTRTPVPGNDRNALDFSPEPLFGISRSTHRRQIRGPDREYRCNGPGWGWRESFAEFLRNERLSVVWTLLGGKSISAG